MKANELMIGDYIRTCKDGVIKVESITTERQHRKAGYYRDGDCYHIKYARLASCEPIPLTEDILKANGFEQDVATFTYVDLKVTFTSRGFVFRSKPMTEIVTGNGSVINNIPRYVHSFQHALRLCGLNDLADNFKLK